MSKSEETRAFIIEKTAPIFNKKGYAGTSLSDMTNATSLTKGSIYGNFANKDEVAMAAFDHNVDKASAVIEYEMAKYKSAKEKILVYGRIYADSGDYSLPVGGCPVLNTATDADDTHPELKAKVSSVIQSWKKKLASIIEEGIRAKEFNRHTDSELAAFTILSLIEGGHMIARVTEKPAYKKAIMNSLRNFVDSL